jgi:nucleoside-diphosphate-sugar epimerase
MKETVLVTGGAGYIGSVLVPALLAGGHSVTVLDNFMYNQTSLLDHCSSQNLTVTRGDCRDREALRGVLHDADIVIPLAAIVGAPACDADPTAARSTNLEAIRMLLEMRSKSQRILFPNTNSGYGIGAKETLCTEETPLRPLSLYGRTKVEAEKTILDAGNAVCFRLATVFGASPRMRVDLLVNDFVYRAVRDRVVVIFEGHFRRNFIHVRDVARVFLHGIERFDAMRGQTFNVGLDDANLSKLELCERIRIHVPGFLYLEAPIGEDPDKRDYIVSNAKLVKTGFVPAFSIDDGIRELVKAYTILGTGRSLGNA